MPMTLPPIHRQLRHTPITRLLTALHWLDATTQPLKARNNNPSTPSTDRKREGHDTAWARNAQRQYHRRIDQLAIEIENRLDPQHGTNEKPSRVRCKGPGSCGRWLTNDSRFCRHCGTPVPKEED